MARHSLFLYGVWEVDLVGVDLMGVDLVGVDLVGVDLMGGHPFYH